MPHSRGNRNGETKIALRRMKISKLMVKGFGLSEIAHTLGISESTAWRDMQKVKDEWAEEVSYMTLRPFKQAIAELDLMRSLIWKMLDEKARQDKDERMIRIQMIYALLAVIRESNKLVGLHDKEGYYITQNEDKDAKGELAISESTLKKPSTYPMLPDLPSLSYSDP